MADSGVGKDNNRLPWLEPYRAPPRRSSNRRAGVTAAIGAMGLAAIVTLLTRDMIPMPASNQPIPHATTVLPAPADMQQEIVLPPLQAAEPPVAAVRDKPARPRRPAAAPRRKIRAIPTNAALNDVVEKQEGVAADPGSMEAALAIAAIPIPPDPPRPAVNPAARIVRGKTVQLGVYLTEGQAEAAWQHAVRDYTYLVTMPKSIQPISIRSKRYYRLQLGTPSKKHARQLCSNLKTIGRACTVA